jgi:hypothetical protein
MKMVDMGQRDRKTRNFSDTRSAPVAIVLSLLPSELKAEVLPYILLGPVAIGRDRHSAAIKGNKIACEVTTVINAAD